MNWTEPAKKCFEECIPTSKKASFAAKIESEVLANWKDLVTLDDVYEAIWSALAN